MKRKNENFKEKVQTHLSKLSLFQKSDEKIFKKMSLYQLKMLQ